MVGQTNITIRCDVLEIIDALRECNRQNAITYQAKPMEMNVVSKKSCAETAVLYFAAIAAAHFLDSIPFAKMLLKYSDLYALYGVPLYEVRDMVKAFDAAKKVGQS